LTLINAPTVKSEFNFAIQRIPGRKQPMGWPGTIAAVLLLTGQLAGAAEAPVAQKPVATPKSATQPTPTPLAAPAKPLTPMAPARFTPRTISTSPLMMTGNRFRPATVTTTPLMMTGTRMPPFRPKTIATDALRMTGERTPPTIAPPREPIPR
jgi:hypothetical protein